MPQQMTDAERAVLKRLGHGCANAVKREDLAQACDIADRQVRDALRNLRNVHGYFVCPAKTRPGGYYIAEKQSELEGFRNEEAAREAHVRENRIACDRSLKKFKSKQVSMF